MKNNKVNDNQKKAKTSDKKSEIKEETVKETVENAQAAEKEEKAAEEQDCKEEVQNDESEKLKAELAEAKDRHLRLAAEFDNYRRRTAKERLELVQTAGEDVIKGILPIMDDFERAIKALESTEGSEAAKEGTELIYNKMMSYLQSKGVSLIEAMNQKLDTDFHEAVAQFPVQEEEKKGMVIDVVQQGYMLNGKVIRFAKVVVGA